MAKTARATILPYWYSMEVSEEDHIAFEKALQEATGAEPTPFEVDPNPFEVNIKPLTGAQQLSLKDYVCKAPLTGKLDYTYEGIIAAIRMGLKGWRNANDFDGSPMVFSMAKALDTLEDGELRKIGYEIIISSIVTDTIRKN